MAAIRTPDITKLQELEGLRAEMERRGLAVPDTPKISARYREWARYYWDKPGQFVKDCIRFRPGKEPTPYQIEVLDNLVDPRLRHRVSARSPHGAGKSALSAWATHWFSLTRDALTDEMGDWKVPTTAGS